MDRREFLKGLAWGAAGSALFCSEADAVVGSQRLLSSLGTASKYNWFVDSVNGNDNNTGKSASQAFQTIGKVNSVLQTAQSVGLARGSYWREQLNGSGAVTFAAYGSGALPILDASDKVLNANFVKTAGFTNVYETPTINFIMGGGLGWANVWETGGPGDSATGQFLQFVSTQALVDSTPGSYTILTMTVSNMPTSAKIYIHTTDGSSPITNGYTYEFANREAGIKVTGSLSKIYNIECRKNCGNNGAIVQGAGSDGGQHYASGVLCRNGNKHNMFVSGGSTVVNSTFINGYYPTGDSMLVFFDTTGSGLPLTASGNIFQQDQLVAGNGTVTAFLSHTASGSFGAVAISNNFYIGKNGVNLGIGIFQNAGFLTVSGDVASQVTGGYTPSQDYSISNSQFVSSMAGNIFVAPTAAFNGTLTNNKACVSNIANSQGMIFLNFSGSCSLTLTNNQLYPNTTASGFDIAVYNHGTASVAYTMNGNDFGGGQSGWYAVIDANVGSTFVGDNNIYEASSFAPSWKWHSGTQITSLATWKALVTPADANAVTSGGSAISACTLPTLPSVS